MRPILLLLVLFLAWSDSAICASNSNKSPAPSGPVGNALFVDSVSVGGLTKKGDPSAPQLPFSFVDVNPTAGPTQTDYQVDVLIKNNSPDNLVMQQLGVGLYTALNPDGSLPANTLPGGSSVLYTDNLPSLSANQTWPTGVIKLTFPSSSIPTSTAACTPFDMALGVNATFLEKGIVTQNTVAVPVKITPRCLSTDTVPLVTKNSGSVPTQVKVGSAYGQDTQTSIPFFIDFTEKVLEDNPLKLFNVTGSNRTDAVYDVEKGQIFLKVYVDDTSKETSISVIVNASVTTNGAGVPNAAASATVEYVPDSGIYNSLGIILTAVFAGVLAASWLTSFLVSCMQPWATAGSLGYGALGFILWAQKLYMTGLIASPAMPANYRTFSDAFAWTNFHAELPWDWSSSSTNETTTNITSSVSRFENNAVVAVDNSFNLLYYDGPNSDPNVIGAPGSAPAAGGATAKPIAAPAAPAPVAAPVPSPSPLPLPAANAPFAGLTTITAGPSAAPAANFVPASPDSCSVFQNTDFFQGDLNNTSFTTSDPNACCSACLANPACYVWSLSLVFNKCYLKGDGGWLQRSNMTCCISGTANRNGLSSILPGGVPTPPTQTPVANPTPTKNPSPNPKKKNGRRLLQQPKPPATKNSTTDATAIANRPVSTRYVLVSVGPEAPKTAAAQPVKVVNLDAWTKAKDIVSDAAPSSTNGYAADTGSSNEYLRIEEAAFWWAIVFALACGINLCGWLFVSCCEGELPGVLHFPRMQLMVFLFGLNAFALEGGLLMSTSDWDTYPLIVGIAVIIFVPLLFLLACYIGIAAAIYRKRKAVYLVNRTAVEDETPSHNKWDMHFVSKYMGMNLIRGKWRPPDPSRKNAFVFRFGPLFEDCRGPLFTRRKTTASPPGATTMRRMPSDMSSQGGYGSDHGMERSMSRSNSSRRKVSAVEEPALATCCGHKVRRSGFQAYGIVFSLLRTVSYALVIGLGQTEPIITTVLLLLLSIAYFGYLRLIVPYSRRDEMALEYFIALLDIIIFILLLVVAAAVSPTDDSLMNGMAIGLIVTQIIAFCCYLMNRMLIIVHAFAEVVCPGCSCRGQTDVKKSKPRRSRSSNSLNRQHSVNSDHAMPQAGMFMYPPGDGKYYIEGDFRPEFDSASSGHEHIYVVDPGMAPYDPNGMMMMPPPPNMMMQAPPDGRSASRSARAGVALMFPAIAEETESQVGSPPPPDITMPAQGLYSNLPSQNGPVVNGNGVASPHAPVAAAPAAAANGEPSAASRAATRAASKKVQLPLDDDPLDTDVFDRFWKSL